MKLNQTVAQSPNWTSSNEQDKVYHSQTQGR